MATYEERRKIRRGLALLLDLVALEENPDPAKKEALMNEFRVVGFTQEMFRATIGEIAKDLF